MSETHVGGEAIHAAVRARDVGKLRELLAAGGDPNALDAAGQPPLRHVLTYGCGFVLEEETCALITALLAAGADPSVGGVATALVADARERADPNAAEVRLLGQPCGRGGAPPPRGGRVRTPGARWAGPPRSRVGAPVAPRARARDRLLALIL